MKFGKNLLPTLFIPQIKQSIEPGLCLWRETPNDLSLREMLKEWNLEGSSWGYWYQA